MSIRIPIEVARRYVLGRQGLWPGRRWRGLDGADRAMRAIEHLQLDPLVMIARAHDLILQSRVIDYRPGDWATLTYEHRKFFDWGGWLAVRPMDELPYWRVIMRRELDQPDWVDVAREHARAIAEMRDVLARRGTVSNRDFATGDRARVDDYRGRKDSALALHYLWRIGDVMVSRRERFERVYALTEAVAPAALIREHDAAEADDFLLMKMVAAAGLTPMRNVGKSLKRIVPAAELAAWRAHKLAEGALVEVRVDGWGVPQLAVAADAAVLGELLANRMPASWAPLESTTRAEATFLAPLDPVSARGRARPLFGFEYRWEVYKPAEQRKFGYYALPILWLEDRALARDAAFAGAVRTGMARFARFLDAKRVDAAAIGSPRLRKALAVGRPRR